MHSDLPQVPVQCVQTPPNHIEILNDLNASSDASSDAS
jgi:hypothetical protein